MRIDCVPAVQFWHRAARVSAPAGALQLFEVMSRFLSPYQLNPFNYNPLRQLILQSIDFERLRQGSAIKLFLSATNVRMGKIKVFTDKEITADCVLAIDAHEDVICREPAIVTARE